MAGCNIYAFSEREQAKPINLMSRILFINSFNKYLFNTYYVSGTVHSTGTMW